MQTTHSQTLSVVNDIYATLRASYAEFREDGQGKNLILKRCPFCKDEKWHFYVSISDEVSSKTGKSKLGNYNCFKCPVAGQDWNELKGTITGDNPIAIQRAITPYDPNKKTIDDKLTAINQWVQDLRCDSDALSYIMSRGFSIETIEHFKLGVAEMDISSLGIRAKCLTIPHFYNQHLANVKFRTLPPTPKKFVRIPGCPSILYNWDNVDQTKDYIYVCEGELDAISLWQAGECNVVSITCGAQAVLPEWYDILRAFEKIYLVFDTDPVGQDGARNMAERLGLERCYNVMLPPNIKDMNDFFGKEEGTLDEFSAIVLKSEKFTIQNIFTAQNVFDQIERNMFTTGTTITGLELPWNAVHRKMGPLTPGDLMYCSGKPGVGKCLTKDSYILTDTGLETLEELHYRITNKNLPTTEQILDIQNCNVRVHTRDGLQILSHFVSNGKRSVSEVSTRTGLCITGTENHPLLTISNSGEMEWKTINNITTDDYVVVNRINWEGVNNIITENEAAFIGYLIADGSLSTKNKIGFSNSDPDIISDYHKLVHLIFPDVGIKVYPKRNSQTIDHQIHSKACQQLLHTRYGLNRVTAKHKTVPLCVRTSGVSVWKSFLNTYFECECDISKDRRAVSVLSASHVLLQQVQLMLLGLGVVSTVSPKKVKAYPNNMYWRLTVTGAACVTLLNTLTFVSGPRKTAKTRLLSTSKLFNTNNDIIPFQSHKIQNISRNITTDREWNRYARRYQVGLRNPSLSRLKWISKYADRRGYCGSEMGYWAGLDGLYFDKVTAIKNCGVQYTYDVCQPQSHEFTANGIVNHNTSLALNIAYHFAFRLGVPSLFFCLEMPPTRLGQKLISIHRNKDKDLINHDDICMTRADFGDVPFYFGYVVKQMADLKREMLFDVFREARKKYGIGYLVFDNIHFLCRSITNVAQEVSLISRSFKLLAEELGIPITVIAHPKKIDDESIMSSYHLKDSSAMHADADVIMLLHRNKMKGRAIAGINTSQDMEEAVLFEPLTKVIIDKSRYEPGGLSMLYLDGPKGLFREATEAEIVSRVADAEE